MNVIRHSVDDDDAAFVVLYDPGEIGVEFVFPSFGDERKSVFGGEDDVVDESGMRHPVLLCVFHTLGFQIVA